MAGNGKKEDREAARIARRTFCAGAALTVAAALSPRGAANLFAAMLRAPQAGQAAEGVFAVTTVNHLSLSVPNYVRTRDFYVDLFGTRVLWDDGRRCALEFGSAASPNGIYITTPAKPAPPTVAHVAFGLPDFWARRAAIKQTLDRRGIKASADGEAGWTVEDPGHFMTPGMQVTPVKDEAMFPGAERPCVKADSPACKEAWQAGAKRSASDPAPGGKGFSATAFSRIVFEVHDVRRERDFYAGVWGMKVLSENYAAGKAECLLGFGQNTLLIRQATGKPRCNKFGFVIENFDRAKAEAELKRRGLDPQPDPTWPLAFRDPDGLRIGVTDRA